MYQNTLPVRVTDHRISDNRGGNAAMDEKVYGYMDWPRIEAIVYGEETAPRDVMGPRITQDGVLISGIFS